MAEADLGAALGGFIPKIDPVFAFVIVLAVILAFIFLIGGAIFLFAVKKNWIILSWPYKVTRFRPSGGAPIRSDDAGAIIQTDKGKLYLRLKSTNLNYELPDRSFINPGDYIYGWSANIREFTPMKTNFVGYMNSAEPNKMNHIMKIKDAEAREAALEEYKETLKHYELQYRPVVSPSAINSAIDAAAEIIENSPKKIDFLPWLVVGGSIVMMLVTFLVAGMMAMKGYDSTIQSLKTDEAKYNAEVALAVSINQSATVNAKLADIFNRSMTNVQRG